MRHAGFTLLEVLVALAVLAIALAGLVKASGDNAVNGAYLRDKTFAHWVAMNRLVELETAAAAPAPGVQTGNAAMADRDWFWRTRIAHTSDEFVHRVHIEVGSDHDTAPLTTLTAYLGIHGQ